VIVLRIFPAAILRDYGGGGVHGRTTKSGANAAFILAENPENTAKMLTISRSCRSVM
jgi:hypothetical protein